MESFGSAQGTSYGGRTPGIYTSVGARGIDCMGGVCTSFRSSVLMTWYTGCATSNITYGIPNFPKYTFFSVEIEVLPRPVLRECNIHSSDEESNDLDLQFRHTPWSTAPQYPFSLQQAHYAMLKSNDLETSRNAKYPITETCLSCTVSINHTVILLFFFFVKLVHIAIMTLNPLFTIEEKSIP